MSWFSDLTSKAEAMLVRLDQDAARTLQNPDTLIRGTRLLDKAISVLDSSRQETEPMLEEPAVPGDNLLTSSNQADPHQPMKAPDSTHQRSVDAYPSSQDETRAYSSSITDGPTTQPPGGKNASSNETTMPEAQPYEKSTGPSTPDNNHNFSQAKQSERLKSDTPAHQQQQQARKFKLQTSKLRQPLFDRQAAALSGSAPNRVNGNGNRSARRNDTLPPTSPGADDIRASINRSLHEYSLTSSTAAYSRLELDPAEQTTYTSHFDSQPNLIQSIDSDNENSRLNDRLQSSPSFSINFPDSGDRATSTDIADQILRQSALKKKSTFNLHKVLNKLAGTKGGHSRAIIGDKTKLRLRRAQMRVASQLRRLNYYFRAYPTMKYWMLGYLVALQLLVIYVLFFYQSSGSSSYLAAQVKQQQQELAEVPLAQSNSEKSIPSSGDFSANGYS